MSATTIQELIDNPHIATSAITGEPLPERASEERAASRERIASKARAEAIAMNAQRKRIDFQSTPTFQPANDNNPIAWRVAA